MSLPRSSVDDFLELVGTGELDEVRRMLRDDPPLVNGVGAHPFWGGRPQALHVAVEVRRRDIFDLLLDAGADVNGVNDQYDLWSPLMLAINRKRPDMRDELIRRGARVGLIEALLLEDDAAVDALAKDASALPAQAPNGGSLLNFARTTFAIDRLIALGADTQQKDRWGSTPIDSMSRMGPRGQPLVRHMIAHGAQAAPEAYARMGDRATLEKLIDEAPSVLRSDAVMMGAVDFKQHALAEWLLSRGANVNARSHMGSRQTALHSAAWNGDLEMVTLLLDAGADITARDNQFDGTPEDWAAKSVEVTNNPKCREVADYLANRSG